MSQKKKRSTVYGKLLFQSFNNWIKLVGCTKAVCPSPSGNNSAFLNGLQLCIFWIVSFALLCPYLPLYIVNLMSLSMWTNSLTKVGLPIFEWTVPRLFVHPWVEIIVLLSMDSSCVFVNFLLGRLINLKRETPCSPPQLVFLWVCELLHWQKLGSPSLSGLSHGCLSTLEWK